MSWLIGPAAVALSGDHGIAHSLTGPRRARRRVRNAAIKVSAEVGDDREHRDLPADRVSLSREERRLRAGPGEHDEGDRSNAVWLT